MHETFLREAIALAKEGSARGEGGPFGAVIVRDGQVLGRGWNRVLVDHDPTAHAEVVAIRNACASVGDFHLPGAIVYASCEPCPMCLAAAYWARVERIYFGCLSQDAAQIGFADDFIRQELPLPADERSIPLVPLLRDEALQVFHAWQANANRRMY
jgi:tRNA(Arg) A34 adenosine deaminase TadA